MNGFFSALFNILFGRRGGTREAPAAPPSAPPPQQPPAPPINTAPPPPPVVQPPVAPPPVAPPAAPPPVNAAERLSPHFTLLEFIDSPTARAQNINNMPSPEILERLRVTAQGMERVRALLGGSPIRINSAYRCPELNAAVGGSATSDHMSGYSVDFVAPSFGSPYRIAAAIEQSDIMGDVDQLIHELGTWVHISFAPEKRNQAKTYHRVSPSAKDYTTGIKEVNAQGYLA